MSIREIVVLGRCCAVCLYKVCDGNTGGSGCAFLSRALGKTTGARKVGSLTVEQADKSRVDAIRMNPFTFCLLDAGSDSCLS